MNAYVGPEGRERLTDALRRQALMTSNETAARDVATVATVMDILPGTDVIIQGSTNSDIFFVIEGTADVIVSDRKVAERTEGQYFGEMALVDPSSTRSATVRAKTQMILARLSEPEFTEIADKHPTFWRRIAIELAKRLREQTKLYRRPNEHPMVFVSAAEESLPAAKIISDCLKAPDFTVNFWNQGTFDNTGSAGAAVMSVAENYDACVTVLGPGSADGVLSLELGVLIGGLGPNRSVIVKPQGTEIPASFAQIGATFLEYDASGGDATEQSLERVARELRRRFSGLPPQLRLV